MAGEVGRAVYGGPGKVFELDLVRVRVWGALKGVRQGHATVHSGLTRTVP